MAPDEQRTTLARPPPADPAKAPIENALEVTEVGVLGADIFTNARQAWVPPGARGIYGGTVVAMCLASAQKTVPEGFWPHSCHCYFLLAGRGDRPILFHVERVRDGRSFATRTVQARQQGRCIFTTTISFVRGGGGEANKALRHAVPAPPEAAAAAWRDAETELDAEPVTGGTFHCHTLPATAPLSDRPDRVRSQHWLRCRGAISPSGGRQAHLNALAFISDSHFVVTVCRAHGVWTLRDGPDSIARLPEDHPRRRTVADLADREGLGRDPDRWADLPRLGMLVSLDHVIYFHAPERVRIDEWVLADMDSPWAGDGRGLVTQRIFASDGTLLATCVQEGLVRLAAPTTEKANL